MVVGNGLIATAFEKYRNKGRVMIFASGVSNSLENDNAIFKREEDLLKYTVQVNGNVPFVYFSSLTHPNSDKSRYFTHKLKMEWYVRNYCPNRIIMKLPQVIGPNGNPNTLFNFLYNKIVNDEEISVYKNSYRSLLDIDDLVKIVDEILDMEIYGNFVINGIEVLEIEEIVNIMACEMGIAPKIKLVPCDNSVKERNSHLMAAILNKLQIYRKDYTKNLIKKYIL